MDTRVVSRIQKLESQNIILWMLVWGMLLLKNRQVAATIGL